MFLQSVFVNRAALGILPPDNFPEKLVESLVSVSAPKTSLIYILILTFMWGISDRFVFLHHTFTRFKKNFLRKN